MYAPLQIFSSYSLLQNPNPVAEIVDAAQKRGYQAISLADNNVMYGAIELYNQAQKAGIKPIFALTLHVQGLINTATAFPLVLTAVSNQGYQNLLWLSSAKMTSPDQGVTMSQLAEHLAGLVLTFPINSELSQLILSQSSDAQVYLSRLRELVGENPVYLGINPQLAGQSQQQLANFSQQNNLPLIAWDRVDYLNPDDAFTTNVLRSIDAGTKLEDVTFLAQQKGENVLKPLAEAANSYQANANLQAAWQHNETVINEAQVNLDFTTTALPEFTTPAGQSSDQYLTQLAEAGLKARFAGQNISPAYQNRLHHELGIIAELGFSDYFLIVWDILNYAHTHDILTGAGRGSAVGSLVAYALHITDVDPLEFGLLFERFLNPSRAQMPDIDIDLPDDRRDEVLDYLHDKYGQRNFAQIITFGTLATKQALRDTARVFNLSTATMSRLSASIPPAKNGRTPSLTQSYEASPALRQAVAELDHGQLLFKTAQQLEGLPRNFGTHAAGVVLSAQPLVEKIPVQLGSGGKLLTQFEKGPVEELGLLKIDLLALTNLKILDQALHYAKADLPDNFDINQIPLNDPETLALFARGDTNGVFQFESNGIQNVLRRLKPESFEHVVAVNALYRPGPSNNIKDFVSRRLGQEPVPDLDPSLKDILAPTYGIMVYQEQVMLVAEAYAGFSLAEADDFRRAISKKDLDKMAKIADRFVAGAVGKGHQRQQAQKLFTYMQRFADYGFNRSHAVAYSKLAFQLAYLKAHYPRAFFTALLNANLGNQDKVRQYVSEARRAGIQVKGPDVNTSGRFWQQHGGQLQMGLHNIRGLRTDLVSALLAERKAGGRFQDVQSLIRRLPEKMRKLEPLQQLVYAGALDHFGYSRGDLLANLPDLIEAAGFGELILQETKMKTVPDLPQAEKLAREKAAIGLNLSGHPLDQYQDLRQQEHFQEITDIHGDQQPVKILALVDKIKVIRTKKGDEMAFLTVSDQSGQISATLFPKLYQRLAPELKAGQVLEIQGKSETRRELAVVANRVSLPSKPAQKGTWFLQFTPQHAGSQVQQAVWHWLSQQSGSNPVVTYWAATGEKKTLNQKYWLGDQNVDTTELERILGAGNVVFKKSQ
ncbi:DNA polymerase III subunit alpha [Lactobacillaceae bacterium L1_55_11]|nr:DNA polymerase III subunit alpha [Lactobacillaceae bacterium L1_55_11]